MSQEMRLLEIIKQNKEVWEVIKHAHKFNLPHCHVGAGCIAQTVWNDFHHYDLTAHIKDIDFVYYDSDLSEEKELVIKEKVKKFFNHIPIKLDVKNQARVHLWYEEKFGYSIKPYQSIQDAISTWPTTATAIGISCCPNSVHIYAPYGLDDLFNLHVRANKKQITQEIYLKKVERWAKTWPQLTIIPWLANP